MSRISLTEHWKHHGSHLWSTMSSIGLHLPGDFRARLFSRSIREITILFRKKEEIWGSEILRWHTQSTSSPCSIYNYSLSLLIHYPSVPSCIFSAQSITSRIAVGNGEMKPQATVWWEEIWIWNTISLPLFVLSLGGKKEIRNITDKEVWNHQLYGFAFSPFISVSFYFLNFEVLWDFEAQLLMRNITLSITVSCWWTNLFTKMKGPPYPDKSR